MHSASPYALSHPARSLLFILLTFERSVHHPLTNSTPAPPEPPGEQENPRGALGLRAQGLRCSPTKRFREQQGVRRRPQKRMAEIKVRTARILGWFGWEGSQSTQCHGQRHLPPSQLQPWPTWPGTSKAFHKPPLKKTQLKPYNLTVYINIYIPKPYNLTVYIYINIKTL